LKQGRVDLDALLARVRAAFPELTFTRATLNDFGEDHAVVILDDAWVFRFPRHCRSRVARRRGTAPAPGFASTLVPADARLSLGPEA
jgi:hypothetical protein